MNKLKIFHQYGHRYCKCGNFGDKLTAFLLQKLTSYSIESVTFRHIRKADLIGVGSILQHIPEDYEGKIWTSGFGFETDFKKFPKAKIVAVRGKQTLDRIDGCDKKHIVLGDGGLLCHLFAADNVSKKYKLGIIPHYIDKGNPVIRKMALESAEIKIIDVCGSCDEVIKEIQECEYIISSSLHGVIAADSLGVPNEWVKLSNKVGGNGFKFGDYYGIFGIEKKEPMLLDKNDNLNGVLNKLQNQKYERKNIDTIKTQLIESIKEI